MQIPQSMGQIAQHDFVVYTACDTEYFDQFGQIFCTSAQRSGQAPVHLHLFNPRPDQLEWCQANGVSTTWEHVDVAAFDRAAANLMAAGGEELRRTQVAMTKGNDVSVQQRIAKTYYACARFIRLAEVHQLCPVVFAGDVDAVVRKPMPRLGTDRDFYIHQIFGAKARFLAGGLYLNPGAAGFVQAYANVLRSTIEQDLLYWSVDQDVLDPVVPRFNYGQLPETLIDWNMRADSVIWTAKGARKNNASFVNEQQQYTA
jgi:hypothetical protein